MDKAGNSQKKAPSANRAPICVVGGGLSGWTAALALATAGQRATLVAPAPARGDRRTTALLAGSVDFLKAIGFWDRVRAQAAPVSVQTLIDDSGRLFRAPYSAFRAAEIGLEAFGYNVANEVLLAELARACEETGRVEVLDATVAGAVFGTSGSQLTLGDDSSVAAELVVAADGRDSAIRRLAGIGAREWRYPQSALALNFAHTQPHHDTCYEFHGRHGPFTLVPLAPGQCGLVWVDDPAIVQSKLTAETAALEREIETRMHSVLGKITIVSDRQAFPLSALIAESFGRSGLVLVGEAAHALPPVAAQGFNLGVRDIEVLRNLAIGRGPGELAAIGPTYHLRRAADVMLRTFSVDLFNRSLLTSFLPVQFGRGLALWALSAVPPLRRAAMREGVAPGGQFAHLRTRLDEARDRLAGRH